MDTQTLALETEIKASLNIDAVVCIALEPVPCTLLSDRELAKSRGFGSRRRLRDWLVGRAALKTVLTKLGESSDTSALSWPHPRISLTHSNACAVSIALPRQEHSLGVGVDLEIERGISPKAAKYFLCADELDCLSLNSNDLLRLWTVKEALFKANPGNHGTWLRGYRLDRIDRLRGSATGPGGCCFIYTTIELANGYLSAARCVSVGQLNVERELAKRCM